MMLVLCLSIYIAYPAMVIFRWNPDNAPLKDGQPPAYIRVYYGSRTNTYTNSVTVAVTNFTSTPYTGYDQYNCVPSTVSNYVSIPIYGLVLSNQIFTAYTFIYPDGTETAYIKEAKCGFTITNKNDKPVPPKELRTSP